MFAGETVLQARHFYLLQDVPRLRLEDQPPSLWLRPAGVVEILHAKVIKYLSCAKCSEVFCLARSVRVEEGTYRKLSRTAGRLQAMRGRPVSLDETIWFLLKGPREEGRISELAGSWEMSESEAKEIERSLREGWKRWNLRQYA